MTPEAVAQPVLTLPPNVVSKADVSRLVNELERVDNDLTTRAVRDKLTLESAAIPAVSEQLTDFVLVKCTM